MTPPAPDTTTHHFQADVTKVLGLVIHSLYSNPEVFLRELLSNASDALDKLRFRAVTEPQLLGEGERLRIRIIPDREQRTLTIWDNGVGMTADQLRTELGTVAHSGTRAFLEKVEAEKRGDVSLIGQFGVGFYSAYLVATEVQVTSRAAGSSEAHRWTSTGVETFTVEPAERECQGTTVVLQLKPEADFLDAFRLRGLVRKFSDFLDHPIELESAPGKTEAVNQGKALWQRRPAEVTPEQYAEFYKHLTHDFEAPLGHRHFQVEGTQLFTALLFIPSHPPSDLFTPEGKHGVRLYVKRVLILESCEELLPQWLRFVRGVVDSDDLPLNVSRELLQDSSTVRVIRKQIVKQTTDLLGEIAREETPRYAELWTAFGKVLKEGLHFEPDQKDRLAPLLRYESSRGEGLVSLEDYKKRMQEGQKAIYYVLAESRPLAERSPHTEALRKRGLEVLYMTDAVDTFAVDALADFDGTPLVSATSAELKLDGGTDAEREAHAGALQELRDAMRVHLQDQVSEVRVSDRLTESPVCLVVPEGGLQPYIERLLRATERGAPKTKRILEVNPEHPLVKNLEALRAQEPASPRLAEWTELLFEQALLAEGSPIEDPGRFAGRLTALLQEVSGRAISTPT